MFKQPKLPTQTDRELFANHIGMILLCVLWFISNLLFTWFAELGMQEPAFSILTYISVGLFYSQLALIGFLLALFPAHLFFRLAVSLFALACVCSSMLFGVYWFDNVSAGDELQIVSMLPTVILGFTIPFAITKHYFGLKWRLEFGDLSSEGLSLSVSSMMIFTAMCAFAIALMRATGDETVFRGLLIFCVAVGATLLFLIPATKAVAGAKRKLTAIGVICGVCFGVPFLLLSFLDVIVGPINWSDIFGIALCIMAFVLSFCIALLLLLRSGGKLCSASTTQKQENLGNLGNHSMANPTR